MIAALLANAARRAVVIFLTFTLLTACGGSGSGNAGGGGNPGGPPISTVVVSGRVTFDRVPIGPGSGQGLDFAAATAAAARAVTVEALAQSGGAVLATGVTDGSGNYSLTVPANTSMQLRVKAEMRRTGTPAFTFRVRDNTASNALYALDGAGFDSGAASSQRDLHAPSGWTGAGYTNPRAAAPFAILDTVYRAYNLVLTAAPNTSFLALDLFWSPGNRAGGGDCQADRTSIATGVICTTFYLAPVANPGADRPDSGIYILGYANDDSDEFDQHVIAHEWGHYYQQTFSRDDSVGGPHGFSDRLDFRLAFSEGWGNAFSAMVLNDSNYRDSAVVAGQQRSFGFDLESNPGATAASIGWFSENSIQSLLWDFYDDGVDGIDTVALGFTPIHEVMTTELRSGVAFSTIYPFVDALRGRVPAADATIAALTRNQQIGLQRGDAFGIAETNAGGDLRNLPLYKSISLGGAQRVCSTIAPNGTINKVGVYQFLRFDLTTTNNVSVSVQGPPSQAGLRDADPDVIVYRAGKVVGLNDDRGISSAVSITGAAPGTYLIEVYEYSNVDPSAGARGDTCIDVALRAN